MLRFKTTRVLLPKADCDVSDCEDAIALNTKTARFAVADGATEAFDSARWARYLVAGWTRSSLETVNLPALQDCVSQLGQQHTKRWANQDLPWYAKEKADQGSFAAFIGIQLHANYTWSALAVGDCCLILERHHSLVRSFPYETASEFHARPLLIHSHQPPYDHQLAQPPKRTTGVWALGDTFLLMSDAIACWYLGSWISDPSKLSDFYASLDDANHDAMRNLIATERHTRALRNDDVAILRIQPLVSDP